MYLCLLYVLTLFQDPSGQLLDRAKGLYDVLDTLFPGDVVIEDREYLTIREKLDHVDLIGYPVTVVVGNKACTNNDDQFSD